MGANAFFVVGEYAVVTARRAALLPRAEAENAGARAALRLMDDPVRVISTVQVGVTAIGILTGAVGEPLVRDLLGEGLPAGVGFVAAFVIVTYLSVVLGELVPKALTLERSEALATLVAPAVESSRSLAGSGRSGLAFDALGRRPQPGDAVVVGDAEIRVKAVAGLRITRLEIVLSHNR